MKEKIRSIESLHYVNNSFLHKNNKVSLPCLLNKRKCQCIGITDENPTETFYFFFYLSLQKGKYDQL